MVSSTQFRQKCPELAKLKLNLFGFGTTTWSKSIYTANQNLDSVSATLFLRFTCYMGIRKTVDNYWTNLSNIEKS